MHHLVIFSLQVFPDNSYLILGDLPPEPAYRNYIALYPTDITDTSTDINWKEWAEDAELILPVPDTITTKETVFDYININYPEYLI